MLLRFWLKFLVMKTSKGASIYYVGKLEEGESPKCQQYYISLCNEPVNEGGSKILKILSTQFMTAPITIVLKRLPIGIFQSRVAERSLSKQMQNKKMSHYVIMSFCHFSFTCILKLWKLNASLEGHIQNKSVHRFWGIFKSHPTCWHLN